MMAVVDKSLALLRSFPIIRSARPRIRHVVSEFREGVRTQSVDIWKHELKYLRYPRQISRSVYLARSLGLENRKGLRLLDIGTGPGYFPFVCSEMGHDVTAIDVDWRPLYNAITRSLSVNRIVHEIRPFEPLPSIPGKFDLITAFLICFNGHKREVWGRPQWEYFLDQLRALAKHDGTRVLLGFNREKDGTTGPAEVEELLKSLGAKVTRGGLFFDFTLYPVE